MSTNLTELAQDPKAFDTRLAELHKQNDGLVSRLARFEDEAHRKAGDKRDYIGRRPVWRMTLHDALAKVPGMFEARAAIYRELADVQAERHAMDEAYTGWSRFFPSITKSQPHIHRSLSCRTLHADTVMSWAPQMSGQTEAEAVADLDEALCSVCFPSAPVALHEYVSKRTTAERAARTAEKDARSAAKARKALTPDQCFRDAHGWAIETVAAAKATIREAIETQHYYPRTWASDSTKYVDAAFTAEMVLTTREAAEPGTGATAAEIEKIKANTRKKIAREG